MRERRWSKGGCLFTVGMVALFVFLGVYKATEGHLPDHWESVMWAVIALSIVTDVYFDLHEAIEKSTDEIKDKIDDFEQKVEDALKAIEERIRN